MEFRSNFEQPDLGVGRDVRAIRLVVRLYPQAGENPCEGRSVHVPLICVIGRFLETFCS